MGCAGCGSCKCGDNTGANATTKEEVNAYYDGLIDGVHMYAWYKDGTMFVGTIGRTYRQAQAELENNRTTALSNLQ